MKLKEFMEMVQECALMASSFKEKRQYGTTIKEGGISCVVYINKDGELSDSDNGTMVQFTIGCPSA